MSSASDHAVPAAPGVLHDLGGETRRAVAGGRIRRAAVLDEFFRVKMRETFHETGEALRADLDPWLVHNNSERPHLRYRNQGRRRIETVMSFVSQEG